MDVFALRHQLVDDHSESIRSFLDIARVRDLFRLQNVSTRRRDKITCDEERLRLGYLLRTSVRFAQRDGALSCTTAVVREGDTEIARMSYGPAATLWRFNYGWRKGRQQTGFDLDVERGTWGSNRDDPDDQDPADGLGPRVRRVVPYVEDRRNCLLIAPGGGSAHASAVLSADPIQRMRVAASLQAALKTAIQTCFQLKDAELAAEPLPGEDDRRLILLYEAAEGGAGALRRLIDDPTALRDVTREALRICHFDPGSGADLRRRPRAKEDCEAVCYDCLMSYSNQPDHRMLDRQLVRDVLQRLAAATVLASPTGTPRAEHLSRLEAPCESSLEREWLHAVEDAGHRLPSRAQALIEACHTRPDFIYDEQFTVIYVDGPHHQFPDRPQRDRERQTCLEDTGYTVLRFGDRSGWDASFTGHPGVSAPPGPSDGPTRPWAGTLAVGAETSSRDADAPRGGGQRCFPERRRTDRHRGATRGPSPGSASVVGRLARDGPVAHRAVRSRSIHRATPRESAASREISSPRPRSRSGGACRP